MTTSFYHCGDIGDIIYSLPVVRAMGGGILYLDVTGGAHLDYIKRTFLGRLKFNQAAYDYIAPLIALQPYITEVKVYNGEEYDVELSEFRKAFDSNKNLVQMHTDYFDLDYSVSDEPWIIVEDRPRGSLPVEEKVLFSRTLRYQSNYPYMYGILMNLTMKNEPIFFIGLPHEYEVAKQTFEGVKFNYLTTPTAVETAKYIKEAHLYITNPSSNNAIAIAMHKEPLYLERGTYEGVCHFPDRKGIIYI